MGWNNINIETYIEIEKINDTLSGVGRVVELLELLTGNDYSEYTDPQELFKLYREEFLWVNTPFNPSLNVIVGDMRLKPLKELNLAEWIDVDNFLSKSDYVSLLSVLYRRFKTDEWDNIEYEPYKYSIEGRNYFTSNQLAVDYLGAIYEALSYRKGVLETFRDVLTPAEGDVTEEELEGLSSRDVALVKEEVEVSKLKSSYSWHLFIHNITGGNWSYTQKVLDLNHLYTFNMLRMRKVFKLND